jgi:2-oxoglutarate ferredoxin oxidoreductase subunit alpha
MRLIDGSRIIIEALVQAGADVFVGYPITPANLLYKYAVDRFKISLPAPDEITTLQWMCGFSSVGKFPVTATSFPGFALMIESINMAYMMELPLVVILAQRLGPSTGSATTSAEGDLLLARSFLSGGYTIPVFCPSNFSDCWNLSNECVKTAINLRTPVILLTSKEMVMTVRSFDTSKLQKINQNKFKLYDKDEKYVPYKSDDNLVCPFLPLGHDTHFVRLNASTHDQSGFIKKTTKEALENTKRLQEKIIEHSEEYSYYEYDFEHSENLIVTYGITADAACDAVKLLREKKNKISLLIIKTIFPVSKKILEIIGQYKMVLFVEENYSSQLATAMFGEVKPDNIFTLNKIGEMISPEEIYEVFIR